MSVLLNVVTKESQNKDRITALKTDKRNTVKVGNELWLPEEEDSYHYSCIYSLVGLCLTPLLI